MHSSLSSLDDEALAELYLQEKKINETLIQERSALLKELQQFERENELNEEFLANSSTNRLKQLQKKNDFLENISKYEKSFIRTCLYQRLDHIRREYCLIQKRIELIKKKLQEGSEDTLNRIDPKKEVNLAFINEELIKMKKELENELKFEIKKYYHNLERQNNLKMRMNKAHLEYLQIPAGQKKQIFEIEQQFKIKLSRHRRSSAFVSIN